MPTKTKTPDYRIHTLRDGSRDVTKLVTVRFDGKHTTLALCSDGLVYTLGRSEFDLTRSWNANDTLRRAWAKLTGHSFADLKAVQRKIAAADAKAEADAKLHRTKRMAAELGYRLVKIKTPA